MSTKTYTGPGTRVRIGRIYMDRFTLDEALDAVERLVNAGAGGAVYTPNVDHIVLAEDDVAFQEAYSRASVALVDGMPVLWATWLLGDRLPEKVSGSDLVEPLLRRAAARGWRTYLLGGLPGAAREAMERLAARGPVPDIVGVDDGRVSLEKTPEQRALVARVCAAKPALVLVALGAPKQELWIDAHRAALGPAVAIAVGAGLDFLALRLKRAPSWLSRAGLEWAHRLAHEPRRLWRRYLVNDPRFLAILGREILRRRREAAGSGRS
jgi:N-acetylglucosaminyldiphosphoundecaprenol N-acetyl-beta-D-mannosaminyltransferase